MHGRLFGGFGQIWNDRLNAVLNLLCCNVYVLFKHELDKDLCDAFDRAGAEFVYAGDGIDGLFDLFGDLGLHLLGEAPGLTTVTVIVGKSIFGNRSTPRLKNENAPTTTSDKINIVAKTGRLTQTSASHCILLYP